jgi:hypothetical protein
MSNVNCTLERPQMPASSSPPPSPLASHGAVLRQSVAEQKSLPAPGNTFSETLSHTEA